MMLRRKWLIIGSLGAGLLLVMLLLASRIARPDTRGGSSSTGTDIGQTAPDFEVTTTDGTTMRSKDLRGQIVVLTSAAAWCQTCALEAQQLASAHEQDRGRGVTFLTVDIDPRDTPASIEAFRSRERTSWPYADARSASSLIRDYELNRFEITYVIDGRGIVRFRDSAITSASALRQVIAAL